MRYGFQVRRPMHGAGAGAGDVRCRGGAAPSRNVHEKRRLCGRVRLFELRLYPSVRNQHRLHVGRDVHGYARLWSYVHRFSFLQVGDPHCVALDVRPRRRAQRAASIEQQTV